MDQLPNLTFNDRAGLLLRPALDLLKPKQLHSVQDGGKGIAEFVTEHRQELVLATAEVRQLCQQVLRLPLQAAAFADVPNVALSDAPVIPTGIDVADKLDLGLLAVFGLE